MATNNNELCFYSVLSDDEKSKASLYYWSNIDSDNMGTTTRPLPPLVLGATDGIVTVKADENNQLYYSYTSAPNGVGKAGRIYIYVVNNGQPAPAIIGMQPAPDDPYDYNILEFNDTSQSGKPGPIWIDLTWVDSSGVPLALTGDSITGESFQSGYAKSAIDITNNLSAIAPKAVIQTNGTLSRVLSPVHAPAAYPSFNPYLQALAQKQTPLSILSDAIPAENNGNSMRFDGRFSFDEKGGVALVLTGVDSEGVTWTVTIPADQLTSENLYGCAGGTLTVQSSEGYQQTRAQNDPDTSDPLQIVINSVFREVCKGLNEGKIIPGKSNVNFNFNFLPSFQVKLADGSIAGNPYVRYLKQLVALSQKQRKEVSPEEYFKELIDQLKVLRAHLSDNSSAEFQRLQLQLNNLIHEYGTLSYRERTLKQLATQVNSIFKQHATHSNALKNNEVFKKTFDQLGTLALTASAYTYPYDDSTALKQTQPGSRVRVYIGSNTQKPFYPTTGLPRNNVSSIFYPTYLGKESTPDYRITLGSGSESLGSIWIGDVCYYPTADGAYDIRLPYSNSPIPIVFVKQDGTRSCIWVSTPFSAPSPLAQPSPNTNQNIVAVDANDNSCLTQNGVPVDASRYVFAAIPNSNIWHLDLGANIGWNPAATSPKRPSVTEKSFASQESTKPAQDKSSRECCGIVPSMETITTVGKEALSAAVGLAASAMTFLPLPSPLRDAVQAQAEELKGLFSGSEKSSLKK